jgi:putative chitinase
MTEPLRTVPVGPGDTLSRIAAREGYTLKEVLAVNPQIHNPNRLSVGQHITLPPPKKFELTVRFVNSWDVPPVGIRYELLDGKTSLAKGRILLDNEATFLVNDGATVTFMAQQIGDAGLRLVGTFVAKREHPVLIARINSFKLPSFTDAHPKTGPAPAAPSKGTAPPSSSAQPTKKDQGAPNLPTKNEKGAAEHQVLPGECACGRALTIDELAAIFPARKKSDLVPFLEPLNAMFNTYKIDSCLRKAHALAQIGHESGSLRYRAEILPEGKTEEKMYNGYKGRGLIQVTGQENYAAYGKFKGMDFLGENRLKLENHEYATDSAGWYWTLGKGCDLNEDADKNDFLFITATINGAFNGFTDRANIFRRTHKLLRADKCKSESNRSSNYLPFEQSRIFDNRDTAFAWGYWNDPKTKAKGVTKDSEASKAGYRRFLELNKKHPRKKGRFGLKLEELLDMAQERAK